MNNIDAQIELEALKQFLIGKRLIDTGGITAINRAIVALQNEEPKTGKWKLDQDGMDWNIPAWRCSECGFVANYIGVEANGFGNSPMNWAGSKFCPQCGARITGYER